MIEMRRAPRAALLGLCLGAAICVAGPAVLAAAPSSSQLQQARRLFEAGRYPQAAAEFRRIAATEENSAEAVIAGYYVGLSEERRGNRDAATAAYRALLTRHGDNTEMSAFARQRLRELEAGGAPRTAEAAAPPASPVTSTAVDRLANTVLSDIMSGTPSRASSSAVRPRPSRRVTPATAPASAAPVWPAASGVPEGFPTVPPGGLNAGTGSDAGTDFPRLTSVTWDRGASSSQGSLAGASSSSAAATSTPVGLQPLGDGMAQATQVRHALPTTEVTANVSAPSGSRPVAAWSSPAITTWEVSVQRAELPASRASGRVPPPAAGTALGGFQGAEGAIEPGTSLSRPRVDLAPIMVPAVLPAMTGPDASSRAIVTPPSAITVPQTAPAIMPARPEARSAAISSPWEASQPSARLAADPAPTDALAVAPEVRVPHEPVPEHSAPAPVASAPVSSPTNPGALEGWDLPAPSSSPALATGASPVYLNAESFSTPQLSADAGTFGDLTLPASPLAPEGEIGARIDGAGARPGVAGRANSGAPLAPLELSPTGVAGRSLPQAGPASPWIEKALSLKRLGQYPEAIAAYRQALAADSSSPVVRNNLADLLVEQGGDLDEAIRLLTEALGMEIADRGPYFSTLGWAYARKGELDSAEKYMDEAVRVQATASRLYRRGRVYAALGQASRARADFDRALVYAEDAATASLVREALAEMDNPIPGQGSSGIIR